MDSRGKEITKLLRKKLTEVYFDSYDVELQPEEAEERYIEDTADELTYDIDNIYKKWRLIK